MKNLQSTPNEEIPYLLAASDTPVNSNMTQVNSEADPEMNSSLDDLCVQFRNLNNNNLMQPINPFHSSKDSLTNLPKVVKFSEPDRNNWSQMDDVTDRMKEHVARFLSNLDSLTALSEQVSYKDIEHFAISVYNLVAAQTTQTTQTKI